MSLRLVKSRNKKTKNIYIRGSHLGVSVDRSSGTNKRSVAQTILNRMELEIERSRVALANVADLELSRTSDDDLRSLDQALKDLPIRKSKRWLQDFLSVAPIDKYGRPIYREAGRDKIIYFDRLLEAMGFFKELDQGEVYFIRAGDFIKIGYTANRDMRLEALQAANPLPVVLLHCDPGGIIEERKIHKRFAHLHEHHEWFVADAELLEYIEGLRAKAGNQTQEAA